jgi:DNA-directed RNA polymerase specialized sigma24 family protein
MPRAAFRNLHGSRLYGFALVLAMGERQWAAQAAAHALAEAEQRLPELRHPERAAAWLRRRVVKQLERPSLPASLSSAERFRALSELSVGHATKLGLDALSVPERAALVASDVERFSPVDVEHILGRRPAAARRLLHSARDRFLAAVADEVPDANEEPGPIARQVEWVAAQAVSPGLAR